MKRVVLGAGLMLASCATPLRTSTGEPGYLDAGLTAAVGFDHDCTAPNIKIIRKASDAADLDVCGQVRRYREVGSQNGLPLWLDVTALYPASALPSSAP